MNWPFIRLDLRLNSVQFQKERYSRIQESGVLYQDKYTAELLTSPNWAGSGTRGHLAVRTQQRNVHILASNYFYRLELFRALTLEINSNCYKQWISCQIASISYGVVNLLRSLILKSFQLSRNSIFWSVNLDFFNWLLFIRLDIYDWIAIWLFKLLINLCEFSIMYFEFVICDNIVSLSIPIPWSFL
jgi:hypothetical protein